MKFVKSLVSNRYLIEGKVYKVEGYCEKSNSVLIANENPFDPNVYLDFPMECFEVYQQRIIFVDFRNKLRLKVA